jgi:hypothetical protein
MVVFVRRVLALALAAAVAGLATVTASCGRTQLEQPFDFPVFAGTPTLPVIEQSVNSDVDIVFMIDNSNSMREEQQNLARNFPVFMNALKSLPEGLPNVHIGIVSSDLGTGSVDTVLGCDKPGGDRGIFQNAALAAGSRAATSSGRWAPSVTSTVTSSR